jgi:hypothetical protein
MTANSLADDRKHFNMRMETLVVGAQDLLQPTLDDCRKMLEGDAAEQEQALRADGKGEEYVLHMMRAEVQYAQQQDQTVAAVRTSRDGGCQPSFHAFLEDEAWSSSRK